MNVELVRVTMTMRDYQLMLGALSLAITATSQLSAGFFDQKLEEPAVQQMRLAQLLTDLQDRLTP